MYLPTGDALLSTHVFLATPTINQHPVGAVVKCVSSACAISHLLTRLSTGNKRRASDSSRNTVYELHED